MKLIDVPGISSGEFGKLERLQSHGIEFAEDLAVVNPAYVDTQIKGVGTKAIANAQELLREKGYRAPADHTEIFYHCDDCGMNYQNHRGGLARHAAGATPCVPEEEKTTMEDIYD
jgi:hypothetical protein